MIATSGFLTALECIKFVFGRAPPRTPMGELTTHPRPPSWLRGTLLLRKKEEREGRRGKRWEEIGEERVRPLRQIPGSATGQECLSLEKINFRHLSSFW